MVKGKSAGKKELSIPPELTDIETDLLWHMQHGYHLNPADLLRV